MGWYNASWSYRIQLTVDHTKVGATLTNFPIFVNLADLPAGFFTNVKNGGGDIRVTQSDGTTELAREVVTCNTGNSTGELHFNGNSLSSSVDTSFYIYYGNSGASDYATNATFGAQNVWDSNYSAVYHMNDGADTSHINDSTSNGLTGTKAGAANPAVSTSGKLGNAQSFNGTTSYISVADNVALKPTAAMTLETWANHTSNSGVQRYFDKNGDTDYRFISWNATNSTEMQFFPNTDNQFTPVVSTSTWYYLVATFDKVNTIVYRNGSANAGVGGTTNINTSVSTLYIGTKDTSADFVNGLLDEMRISKIARTATWISTQYNNQNSSSTFYSNGGQQSPSGGGGAFLFNFL